MEEEDGGGRREEGGGREEGWMRYEEEGGGREGGRITHKHKRPNSRLNAADFRRDARKHQKWSNVQTQAMHLHERKQTQKSHCRTRPPDLHSRSHFWARNPATDVAPKV